MKSYEQLFDENARTEYIPDSLRVRAIAIMKRFNIRGICDGMYICNCIAFGSGMGDGNSHFKDGEISNIQKTADYLLNAYACNIFPEDKADLMQILKTGFLEKERYIKGLKNHVKHLENDKKRWRGVDGFRFDYAEKCRKETVETINNINGGIW